MKKIFLVFIVFAFAISCDREEKGYLSHTIEQKARMQKIVFVKQAQDAIQMYRVQNNKWPSSLEEIQNLPQLPQNWEWIYDNTKGTIEIKQNQP